MKAGVAYKRELRRQAREYVREYLYTHPCEECGNDDVRVLQFHHVDPKLKTAAISTMVSKGYRVKDIKLELEKTIVLCANCHSILHHEERVRGI